MPAETVRVSNYEDVHEAAIALMQFGGYDQIIGYQFDGSHFIDGNPKGSGCYDMVESGRFLREGEKPQAQKFVEASVYFHPEKDKVYITRPTWVGRIGTTRFMAVVNAVENGYEIELTSPFPNGRPLSEFAALQPKPEQTHFKRLNMF